MGLGRTAATGIAWAVAAALVCIPLVQPGGLLRSDLALASSRLSVSGSVADLQPGVPAELVLVVHNDEARDVVVRRLTAEVVDGGGRDCPTEALSVAPWSGRLSVPAGGSAAQPLTVLLDPSATCVDVRWELRYTAQGE